MRPFVFRKYLDYGTLDAMRRLHAEVRRDVARRELAEHVKLGPGGIREIEFIAQALQLIRGGRDAGAHRAADAAGAGGSCQARIFCPKSGAASSPRPTCFLRNVEHRLQYLDDAQRHDLPAGRGGPRALARHVRLPVVGRHSRRGWTSHRAAVTRHFQAVFAEREAARPKPWPEHPRLAALRASQRYAALPDDSRRRLDALMPGARARRGGHARAGGDARARRRPARGDREPRRLPRAARREPARRSSASRASSAPRAGRREFVTRHPLLLDELLDDRVLYAPLELESFSKNLRAQLAAHAGDAERQMNVLRELHQAQVFRLLAQDLAGLLTVEKLADHLSALADLVLADDAASWSGATCATRHREDAPRFAVIGYGKLGGKELGYASDLDIIFLYDDADERAPEVYARLAQRINNWLTTRTSAGVLFDTDLRLRPSGASGLLVSSIEAFERYQEQDAWVWEHQALTRARYCAGDAERRRRVRSDTTKEF